MVLYAALNAGIDMDSALCMPLSMAQDIIATHEIMTMQYERVLTDPDDIEADFIRTMSAR